MTITLHSFVAIYTRALDTAAHLLTKGIAFATENGIADSDLLSWRLVDDMNPLAFQVAVVINFSTQWTARAAGLPVPESIIGADHDVAGLQTAIASAKAYLAALTPEQFAGRDDVPVTVQITDTIEPTLPVGRWIASFATTNVHFHLSMAYAILRMKGVPLGKIDMFPTGL